MRERPRARVGPRDRDRPPADPDLGGEVPQSQFPDREVRGRVAREAASDAESVTDALDLKEQPPLGGVDRHVDSVDGERQVVGLDREGGVRASPAHES